MTSTVDKCQCITSKGVRCTRSPSTKPGDNHSFCWQHQKCKTPVESIDVKTKTEPIKTKVNPIKTKVNPIKPKIKSEPVPADRTIKIYVMLDDSLVLRDDLEFTANLSISSDLFYLLLDRLPPNIPQLPFQNLTIKADEDGDAYFNIYIPQSFDYNFFKREFKNSCHDPDFVVKDVNGEFYCSIE